MFKAVMFADHGPFTRNEVNARSMRQTLANLAIHAAWYMANGEPAETLLDECCRLSCEAQRLYPQEWH